MVIATESACSAIKAQLRCLLTSLRLLGDSRIRLYHPKTMTKISFVSDILALYGTDNFRSPGQLADDDSCRLYWACTPPTGWFSSHLTVNKSTKSFSENPKQPWWVTWTALNPGNYSCFWLCSEQVPVFETKWIILKQTFLIIIFKR